jgi:integrase/recombinase XerD
VYFTGFASVNGIENPAEVTSELVLRYQIHLHERRKASGDPLSVATQVQRLIPLAQFFDWLRREQRIDDDPTKDLVMPRPDRRLPESTLSAAELSRLMAVPDVATAFGLRDRAILEVFYSSALRRGELISLHLRDIDFDRGTLFVRHGKGSKDRYVPVGERALFWVRHYVGVVRPQLTKGTSSEHVFVSSMGTSLCPDWLCRKVRQYLAKAGIDTRGSCHLLRHSVATLMLEGGADIRYVAKMLGHARLETTQQYTRVSIDRLRFVHSHSHPAAGVNVAMAVELSSILPESTNLARSLR